MTTKHELAELPMLARKTNGDGDEATAPEHKIGETLRLPTPAEQAARRWQARFDQVTASGEMPGLERADVRRLTDIAFERLKRKHRDKYDDDALLSAAYAYGTIIAEDAAAGRRH